MAPTTPVATTSATAATGPSTKAGASTTAGPDTKAGATLTPTEFASVVTAITGAFAVSTGLLTLDSICDAISEEVPIKAEQNVLAAREAAEAVRVTRRTEVAHV